MHLTPTPAHASGTLIFRLQGVVAGFSSVTTVCPPARACATRNESATPRNSLYAAAWNPEFSAHWLTCWNAALNVASRRRKNPLGSVFAHALRSSCCAPISSATF